MIYRKIYEIVLTKYMEGQISELNLGKIMDCEGNYVKVRWGKGISLTNPIIPVAA